MLCFLWWWVPIFVAPIPIKVAHPWYIDHNNKLPISIVRCWKTRLHEIQRDLGFQPSLSLHHPNHLHIIRTKCSESHSQTETPWNRFKVCVCLYMTLVSAGVVIDKLVSDTVTHKLVSQASFYSSHCRSLIWFRLFLSVCDRHRSPDKATTQNQLKSF